MLLSMCTNQPNTLRPEHSKRDRIRLLVTIFFLEALASLTASWKPHLLHHHQVLFCCGHSYSSACIQLLQSNLTDTLSAQFQPKSVLLKELNLNLLKYIYIYVYKGKPEETLFLLLCFVVVGAFPPGVGRTPRYNDISPL